MKVCIHRGARQIGGSCVELRSQGHRLILDAGMPLDVEDEAAARLPSTLDLAPGSPPIAGVVISHPHRDHYGLASLFGPDTSYLIGEDAHRILRTASAFTLGGVSFKKVVHLQHRRALEVGPFTVSVNWIVAATAICASRSSR